MFSFAFLYTPCSHLYSCYATSLDSPLPSLWQAEFWSPGAIPMNMFYLMWPRDSADAIKVSN